MKRLLRILLLSAVLILPCGTVHRVQAIEPVTMVLLAPVALKVYEAAEPRLVKGAKYGGKKMVQIGGNVLEILYLPLGVVQTTIGAPFGFMSSGLKNIGKGIIAPGKMVLNVLALPFSLCGVNI